MAKSNEQRAERNEQRAKSNEHQAKSKVQRATSKKINLVFLLEFSIHFSRLPNLLHSQNF